MIYQLDFEIPRDRDQIEGRGMAKAIRRAGVRQVPLSEVKDDLSRFLLEAEGEEIVITRNGKPAGVLIGFAVRIEQARQSLRSGRGVRIEDVE